MAYKTKDVKKKDREAIKGKSIFEVADGKDITYN